MPQAFCQMLKTVCLAAHMQAMPVPIFYWPEIYGSAIAKVALEPAEAPIKKMKSGLSLFYSPGKHYLCMGKNMSGMKMMSRLWLFMVFLAAIPAVGQTLADSLQVSLLTCAPGTKVYELYGHTAIRVRSEANKTDIVYNYGMFNSRQPRFVWRFIQGETDYELGVENFGPFAASYIYRGRDMEEQMLNLAPDEKARLAERLERNARPENRRYRYNFLYDNCTTRAVAQIEACLNGQLLFEPDSVPACTFRDIIHEFSDDSPWFRFGQDLLLGSEVDTLLDRKGAMFSPVYAEAFLANAYVREKDGTQRKLVTETLHYERQTELPQDGAWISPLFATMLLLGVTLCVCLHERRRWKACTLFDDVLMLAQGGTGCVIALLFFCSEHPAVGTNWLIIWLNPLPLLYLPVKIRHDWKGMRDAYQPVAAAVLTVFFILAPFSGQHFPPEILLLALILLIRAISGSCFFFNRHLCADRRKGWQTKR